MGRLIEIGLGVLVGGAIVAGAYQAGKYVERSWWRQELASRNQEVAATMSKLGTEADDLDQSLLRIIEGDRAKLTDAENKIQTINRSTQNMATDGGDVCRPVPAHCLQRGRSDSRAQTAGTAAGSSGPAR